MYFNDFSSYKSLRESQSKQILILKKSTVTISVKQVEYLKMRLFIEIQNGTTLIKRGMEGLSVDASLV